MLKLKRPLLNNKGFTLIELVLGVAIMSMLIITLYTSLDFTLKISRQSIIEDELLLNGRYILEYVKEEICSADKIIASYNFKDLDRRFPTNIGFVILKLNKEREEKTGKVKEGVTYSYTTYYFMDDSIIRINTKDIIQKNEIRDIDILKERLPRADDFSGYNTIGYDLSEESLISLNEQNIVSLDLYLKKDTSRTSNFKSDILVRCEVVK